MTGKLFNWTDAEFDQFLLKVGYVGTHYFGLAYQNAQSCSDWFDRESACKKRRLEPSTILDSTTPDWLKSEKSIVSRAVTSKANTLPTIEGALFDALMRSNMVKTRDQCNFSRCGRTDRGVHARANYVSLQLRLKPTRRARDDHYDYVRILNAMLPRTVRVFDCIKVPIWFDARFHCLNRAYKYFFPLENLNLDEMRLAASQFLGDHDFRNFCKIDPDAHKTFRRRVLKFSIVEQGNGIAVANVVGPAFLWHQVRCMMGALFLVGNGSLGHSKLIEWLDVDKTPEKPAYKMAGPEGLILWDCVFEGLHFTEKTGGAPIKEITVSARCSTP